jgi:ketosteroid isomerase-like protein
MEAISAKLSNVTVKAAIEALQSGDKAAWHALFEPDAELLDDGHPRSLVRFTEEALGHERFTSLDRVSHHGLDLAGHFHSDEWGDFQAYFRFTLSDNGKIQRLEIGQLD